MSPNTIAKAYAELAHEGILERRHGAGAFIAAAQKDRQKGRSLPDAHRKISELVNELREWGIGDDEIRRAFESAVLHHVEALNS